MTKSQSFNRVLLFGAGAVGGYFGALLSMVVPVDFVARGRKLEVFQDKGLTLEHALTAEKTVYKINAVNEPAGKYDLIIIAVKSKDTPVAAEACKSALADNGIVLSLQNGVGNIPELVKVFGEEHVVGAVVNSGLSTPQAGVVKYVPHPVITAGGLSSRSKSFESSIVRLFIQAGIDCRTTEDIHKSLWTKLIWNISFNTLSALMMAKCGELLKDANSLNLMQSIARETVQAALYNGVKLDDDIIERTFRLDSKYEDYKTSALQDVEANRAPELEPLLSPVVSLHKAGKISAPHSQAVYDLVCFKFNRWFHTSPRLAADVLVVNDNKVLLIERKYPPYGWAIPGGMVDYGEKVETAASRELGEETNIFVDESDLRLIGIYSDPDRDFRGHTVSVVYYTYSDKEPKAADDAKNARYFSLDNLPELAFDHAEIIGDFKKLTTK